MLLIGDGVLDFCVVDCVDFVFVKYCFIEYCCVVGIVYVLIIGFEDVLEFLFKLFDGSLLEVE